MQGYIYLIENKINNKKYVGCTAYTLECRFQEHIKDLSRFPNRPLYRAMKKYGIENFSMIALERCDESLLTEREIYWIKKLDTYKNGYNATLGGEGRKTIDQEKVVELYKKYQVISKVASELGHDPGSVRKILNNNNVPLYKGPRASGHKVAAYDLKTGEKLQVFSSQYKAGEWIQALGKTKITDVRKVSYLIGRAAKRLDNRIQAYGFRWEFE